MDYEILRNMRTFIRYSQLSHKGSVFLPSYSLTQNTKAVNGLVFCLTRYIWPADTDAWHITYNVLLSQPGGRIQYARIGSNVTMQCGSLDNDASVTWKVNGTDVKAKRREEGPRLILMEVDMSSNGLYSCFQNPDGQRRDQITFRIGRESNRSSSVLFPSYTSSYFYHFFCTSWSFSHCSLTPYW